MRLTDENIASFQEIYKNKFGKEISREDAYEKASKLVRLMQIVYKPMTKEEFETTKKRQEELLSKDKK
jgi:hypothetical protein